MKYQAQVRFDTGELHPNTPREEIIEAIKDALEDYDFPRDTIQVDLSQHPRRTSGAMSSSAANDMAIARHPELPDERGE